MMKERFFNLLRRGDPFIWLTSTGLAVALVMVVTLLSLIIVNGVSVFWPQHLAQVTLVSGESVLLGKVVKRQQKAGFHNEAAEEWQMFIGNRDVTGASFRFLDVVDIGRIDYPRDAMIVERIEFGDAIGLPVAFKDGSQTTASADARFLQVVSTAVNEAVSVRERIQTIEKGDIGLINARLERMRVQEKALVDAKDAKSVNLKQRIADEKLKLEEAYIALAANAKDLRQRLNGKSLVLRLSDGAQREIPLAQIVGFHQPNAYGFFGKVGHFAKHTWAFLSQEPREANTEGGIFPAIFGTFVMTLLMSLSVTPFGVLAAIYLREYAKQGAFVRAVRIAVNNLAGVPSIVFGIFGVGFFVYTLGAQIDAWFFSEWLPTPTFGTGGILWASLTLALLTVPVVIVSSEEALASVPRGMREGSLACGASKWQTIQRIVLPASTQGILTGMILAMARGAGEVAPLMLVGVVKLAPSLPIDGVFPFVHLDQKFMHLGFHIYDLGFQSPDSEAAKPMVFATTLFLILLVVALNLAAILIREKLRKKYAVGAF